jgi:hypothetical protein
LNKIQNIEVITPAKTTYSQFEKNTILVATKIEGSCRPLFHDSNLALVPIDLDPPLPSSSSSFF